jgi:hypothetical protein
VPPKQSRTTRPSGPSSTTSAASPAAATPWPTTLPADPARALEQVICHLPAEVVENITAYQPWPLPACWGDIADLVRLGLAGYLPPNLKSLGRYSRIVTAHVGACHDRGADLSVPGVWASAQVEHTLAVGANTWSVRSRASMAAPLRRISRNLAPHDQPLRQVKARRYDPVAPYNTGELATLVEAVTTLDAPMWRARASLVLALSAGAGLTDADLRLLGPDSITTSRGPVRVVVPDSAGRGRTVPVHRDLSALAVHAHGLLLACDPRLNGGRAERASTLFCHHHVATNLWNKLAWHNEQRPTVLRLRATWTALVLSSGCGLPAFLRAAHVTSYDSWYGAVAHLEDLDEAEYLAQARGDARLADPRVKQDALELGAGMVLDGNPWPSPRVPLRPTTTRPTHRKTSSKGGR